MPTPAQAMAWPAIAAGRPVLIAAPTGSGKTLAAFLAAIDGLVREGLAGRLEDATQIVYVSPLKALSNDIRRNLEIPLAGIRAELRGHGPARGRDPQPGAHRRHARGRARRRCAAARRTSSSPPRNRFTSCSARNRAGRCWRRPAPSSSTRSMRWRRRSAAAISSLSLERLAALAGDKLLRIGLSATQKPIEGWPSSWSASADGGCTIVDTGHRRARDLAIEVPSSPLEAVMSGEVWDEIYDRLAELIRAHRTTLVFVNTRRLVERVTRHLSERIGAERVAAHHGSLAKEQRLDAEQRLKGGALDALVATASLELGIDIGEVDLVCQLGSPRGDRDLPAARRPLRPCGRRHPEGPAVPAVARRAGRMRRPPRQRAPRRARRTDDTRAAARRLGAADRRRGRGSRTGARRRCTRSAAAPGPTATCRAADFAAVVAMLARGLRDAARPPRRARSTTTRSTTGCAAAAAPG